LRELDGRCISTGIELRKERHMVMRVRLIWVVILITGLVAAAFLTGCSPVTANPESSYQEAQALTPFLEVDATYEDWMSRYRRLLENLPLNQVPILGSHDAGTCDLTTQSPPCHGWRTRNGRHIVGHPSLSDVTSARCQSATIKDQLRYGVRYFDLRVAKQYGAYWIAHMWLSTPLQGKGGVFTQIKAFLSEHPDEIIILSNHTLYSGREGMSAHEARDYYHMVEREFGSALVPAGDFATTTLGSIWQGSGRVVLIGDVRRAPLPFIWNPAQIDAQWMDVKDPDQLCFDLDSVVAAWSHGVSATNLRVLQAVTTTREKIRAAAQTNPLIRKRLVSTWRNAPINVVQVDDSVNSGLMPTLVERIASSGG